MKRRSCMFFLESVFTTGDKRDLEWNLGSW